MSIMSETCINIYLPEDADPTEYPQSLFHDFHMSVDYKIEFSWMFYLMLRGHGLNVKICSSYPDSGILLIHRGYVNSFECNPELFVVSMQWDYKRDDRAQVHLVSNEYKTRSSSLEWLDRISFSGLQYFVQPPLHTTLVKRSDERADVFENMAFIGAEKNLSREFRDQKFKERMEQLGMKFTIVDNPDQMADYSNIDVAMAVRKLGKLIDHKPPQKLINAWRAGVPSILGREVGYQELYESDLDYLAVDSVDEVLAALERLKSDVSFRKMMVQNGLKKAESYQIESLQYQWGELFREKIIPAYARWEKTSRIKRMGFLVVRKVRYHVRLMLSFIRYRILALEPRY